MSSTYARMRSTEAPMPGLEFTNRPKSIPVWRSNPGDQTTPLKRTHSVANPPPSPFNIHRNTDSKPILGNEVRFLFTPPKLEVPTSSTSFPPRSRTPDTPDILMNDLLISSPTPSPKELENDVLEETKEVGRVEKELVLVEPRPMSNVAVKRVERARRIATEKNMIGRRRRARFKDHEEEETEEEEFDDEVPRRPAAVTRKTSNHYTLNMPSPAQPAQDMPYILLGYVQVLFNLSLILVFLYLLLQFIITVQRDVEERVSEYSMDILQEITTCSTLYKTNLCSNPIPAMMHQCASWETCMNRDPKIVGRAKVGAEMLAEVVNGFVEPISWKTLIFTLSSLSFLTVFVNALLSLYRSRHHPDKKNHPNNNVPAHISHPQPALIPMSPYHPAPHGYGYLPASWHPDKDIEPIPSRRRRLENGEKAIRQ